MQHQNNTRRNHLKSLRATSDTTWNISKLFARTRSKQGKTTRSGSWEGEGATRPPDVSCWGVPTPGQASRGAGPPLPLHRGRRSRASWCSPCGDGHGLSCPQSSSLSSGDDACEQPRPHLRPPLRRAARPCAGSVAGRAWVARSRSSPVHGRAPESPEAFLLSMAGDPAAPLAMKQQPAPDCWESGGLHRRCTGAKLPIPIHGLRERGKGRRENGGWKLKTKR
jgi:hypothetical protein